MKKVLTLTLMLLVLTSCFSGCSLVARYYGNRLDRNGSKTNGLESAPSSEGEAPLHLKENLVLSANDSAGTLCGMIAFTSNQSFEFLVNLYEGYGTLKGNYRLEGDEGRVLRIVCTVTDVNFSGFAGDTLTGFTLVANNTGYTINLDNADYVGMVSRGMSFYELSVSQELPEEDTSPRLKLMDNLTLKTYDDYGILLASITFVSESQFEMTVNLYEGWGTVKGNYSLVGEGNSVNRIMCTVTDVNFSGFIGDNVSGFMITPHGMGKYRIKLNNTDYLGALPTQAFMQETTA